MLTTPDISENDDVFPGERWFLYWKTSASLWESRLRNFAIGSQIYVPVNWSVHCENPDQYDFGNIKPESDLLKLYSLAKSLNIKLSFILGCGPMPFIANGAIPSFLAKTNSIGKEGTQIFTLDRQSKLNKIFSFYNPRIFQYYSKFLKNLNIYFTKEGVDAEVIGVEAFYFEDDHAISYFDDYSDDFKNGFDSFLSIQDHKNIALKKDYKLLIEELYINLVKKEFKANFVGFNRIIFLGAGLKENIERSMTKFTNRNNYFESLFFAIFNNYLPSSILLNSNEKDDCLNEAIKKIVNQDLIEKNLENKYYDDEDKSLRLFSLFKIFSSASNFLELGLRSYFKNNFQWTYELNPFDFKVDEKIYFFLREKITEDDYNFTLKTFMNGGTVFLDSNSLSDEQNRKLSVFLTENSILTSQVRIGILLKNIRLGDGQIFLFESNSLRELNEEKKIQFWQKIIETIDIKHPMCSAEEGLYFVWQHRSANTYELDYEQVRRVNIFNPSNYKRKMKIESHKHLAFLKIIDQKDVTLKSSSKEIEIELKPKSSVSLDFGLYD